MDVLLTGASGFIGRNLLLHLPADWQVLAVYNRDTAFPDFVARLGRSRVTAAACDLTDPDAVSALFREHGRCWDLCVYLAARVDIPWSVREPKQDLLVNTGGLLHVLDGLRAARCVYFSSGAVYEGLTGEVRPQMQIHPTLPYAISKQASEQYVKFCRERNGNIDNYLIVRFFGAYGPYEAPHKIYTRLIRAFDLEGRDWYEVYGDGSNLIDAMYVEDAVDAILRMLNGQHWNDTVNLAAGRPVTIEALVREVAAALGVADVRIDKRGIAHETNQFWGSTAEMAEYYGFTARTKLADGILRFREFMRRWEEQGT